MKLKLVALDICPFAQRCAITLQYKKVAHEVEYIDLNAPPEWFARISPMGKVPVLLLDDDRVLFESAIINEFIDDITPPLLKPADPYALAQNRSWIEFGSNCLSQQYQWMTAATTEDFEAAGQAIVASLHFVEDALTTGPWFNGEDFSLVDTAFAPLLMRYRLLDTQGSRVATGRFPKISAWTDHLLDLPAVQKSVPQDFADRLYSWLGKQPGFGPAQLIKARK